MNRENDDGKREKKVVFNSPKSRPWPRSSDEPLGLTHYSSTKKRRSRRLHIGKAGLLWMRMGLLWLREEEDTWWCDRSCKQKNTGTRHDNDHKFYFLVNVV